jgi:hypothetical protein
MYANSCRTNSRRARAPSIFNLDVPTAFAEQALLKCLPVRSQTLGGNALWLKGHKNWRELCKAALEVKDPDELLKILHQLNQALKREEQVRREFREAVRAIESSAEGRY